MAKHDSDLDTLFQALSDPTRRAVLNRLMRDGATAVSDLAAPFDMALPSFMGHLTRLERAGLIHTEKRGRSRICRADPSHLTPVQAWIEDQRAIWNARLDRLEDYLETLDKDATDG